jgi:hypothetical protein
VFGNVTHPVLSSSCCSWTGQWPLLVQPLLDGSTVQLFSRLSCLKVGSCGVVYALPVVQALPVHTVSAIPSCTLDRVGRLAWG